MLIAWLVGCTLVVQEEVRELGPFDEVANLSRADVEVLAGDEPIVAVVCVDDQIERLVTEVVSGELQIRTEHRFGDVWTDCQVTVMSPLIGAVRSEGEGDTEVEGDLGALSLLENAGSGSLQAQGELSDLELVRSSGAGGIEVDGLSTISARIDLTGSGSVQVTGTSRSVELDSEGAGELDARALEVSFADIVSRGSGDVSLYVTEEATVTLTGAGDVWLAGQPTVEVDDRGTGDVTVR